VAPDPGHPPQEQHLDTSQSVNHGPHPNPPPEYRGRGLWPPRVLRILERAVAHAGIDTSIVIA